MVTFYVDGSDPAQAFLGIVTPDGRTWCSWCERQVWGQPTDHWCAERQAAAEAYQQRAPRLSDVRREVEAAGGWDAYLGRSPSQAAPMPPAPPPSSCHCMNCLNRRERDRSAQ